jgi:hypothetical protein
MHRSGTSALARTLNLHGVDFGADLRGADFDNPKGFWEHNQIVSNHKRLLEAIGSDYDDIRPLPLHWWQTEAARKCRAQMVDVIRSEFGSSPLWAFKDPRTCRLVKLWHGIMADSRCNPKFVIIFRNPLEVATSFQKRNGFHMDKSFLLWLTHVTEAELETRYLPRVFVSFERLISDWSSVTGIIAKTLQITWQTDVDTIQVLMDDFLDPSLKHHNIDDEQLNFDSRLPELLLKGFRLLKRAEGTNGEHLLKEFCELRSDFQTIMESFIVSAFSDTLLETAVHLHQNSQQIHVLQSELEECRQKLSSMVSETQLLSVSADDYKAGLVDCEKVIRDKNFEIENLREQVQNHRELLAGVYKSHSWKITAPLRFFMKSIKFQS